MGFEQAQQAMTEAYGGGKVNPGSLNPQTGSAPDATGSGPFKQTQETKSSSQESSPDTTQTPEQALEELTPQQQEEILDIMSLGKKIKIGDKVMTAEEFKRAHLRWEDYTKKTQELAQERKEIQRLKKLEEFENAFESDLEKLLADPDKWEDTFRKIYPESYQKIYDRIKASREQFAPQSTRSQAAETQQVNPELDRILQTVRQMDSRLSNYEQMAKDAQIEKESVRLDNVFAGLHKKYDLGDQKANEKLESLVLARAQLLERDPTDKDLEKFFKEEFDSFAALAKAHGEKQFRGQQTANQQARDVASGGGVPSSAPQTPKNFKEAREAMEKHLIMQGRR